MKMAQSGIILNVQNQLEDILNNQNLIVQNQADMIEKLNSLENRLATVEKCLLVQQQVPLPSGISQVLASQKQKTFSSLQSSPRQQQPPPQPPNPDIKTASASKDRIQPQKQLSPSHSMIAAAAAAAASAVQASSLSKLGSSSSSSNNPTHINSHSNSSSNHSKQSHLTNHTNLTNHLNPQQQQPQHSPPNHTFNNLINNHNYNSNSAATNHNNSYNHNHNLHSPLNLYQQGTHSQGSKLLQQHMASSGSLPGLGSGSLLSQRQQLNRMNLGKLKMGLINQQQSQMKSQKRLLDRSRHIDDSHEHEMDQTQDEIEEGENINKSQKLQNDENKAVNENEYVEQYMLQNKLKLGSQSAQSFNKMIAAAGQQLQQQQQQQITPYKQDDDDEEDYDDDDDGDDENQQLIGSHEYSDQQQLINENDIRRIFAVSKSRGNFAALLVQQMYARHERIMSNVMGTRGKRQLSPNRMLVVKTLAFQMYPPPHEREEETIWKKECVKAIDSKNRKVRINPSGSYSSNTPKIDTQNQSPYSQFLNLASSPLTTSHLSRSASASNTAALAAAVAAALSSKQQQQSAAQNLSFTASNISVPSTIKRESIQHQKQFDTTTSDVGDGDSEAREQGEIRSEQDPDETNPEACSDIAQSIPSNSSSTVTNPNALSDFSADR